MFNRQQKAGLLVLSLVMFFFIALSSVNAEEYLGVFKQNENVRLLQTCSVCGYVTLDSVKLPNSTLVFINENMTSSGSTFFYDFNITDLLGEYLYNTHYENYTAPVSFEITIRGEQYNDSQQGLIIAQGILLALFIAIGFSFSKEKWKLRGFFFMLGLFMGLLMLNSIRILAGTSSTLDSMVSTGIFIGIIAVSFMALYLLIIYTIELFKTMKNKKEMRWQVSDRFN